MYLHQAIGTCAQPKNGTWESAACSPAAVVLVALVDPRTPLTMMLVLIPITIVITTMTIILLMLMTSLVLRLVYVRMNMTMILMLLSVTRPRETRPGSQHKR